MALAPSTAFGPRDLADRAAELGALPAGTALKVGTQTYLNPAGFEVQTNITGLTATGTTQATALVLTRQRSVVTTVAAGAGVVLVSGGVGVMLLVVNRSANALLVYPVLGGSIGLLAVNAAVTVAAGTGRFFLQSAAAQWDAI